MQTRLQYRFLEQHLLAFLGTGNAAALHSLREQLEWVELAAGTREASVESTGGTVRVTMLF